jgi:AraC family transcriptional regulator, exoenzyme S synthesis regulatory protein ExsA
MELKNKNTPISSPILYTCYSQKTREGERFIAEHLFGYTLAGNSEVYLGDKVYGFKEGSFWFFRKNQLARFIKHPPPGGECASISISMDKDTLLSVNEAYNIHMDRPYTGENVLYLEPNNLFKNYIDSLTPHLHNPEQINPMLTKLKVKEAIIILLDTNPGLKDILFDFSEPGKIDLETYMNEHYKFNVGLHRFAYLTGRSLATFKRDFSKIFNTSPKHWLQQRRLREAYYLIKEKGKTASEVYLEVGFEDLSHFSFAFKKAFGVSPSLIAPKTTQRHAVPALSRPARH